jgi:hypothetical protein
MSLFNEFNFNEPNSSFNDSGTFIIGISASISTESSLTVDMSVVYHITSAIDTNSDVTGVFSSQAFVGNITTESSVYGICNAVDVAASINENRSEIYASITGEFLLSSNIDVDSEVIGLPENICNTTVAIDTSSLVVGGFGLLRGYIVDSLSLVDASLHIIHGIVSTGIDPTESVVNGDASVTHDSIAAISTETTIASPTCYYDTSSIVCANEPVLSRTLDVASDNIDTSSSVSESELELYFRLYNEIDDVTGSSDVSGTMHYVRGGIGNINTESSVTGHIVYETNFGSPININTGSELPIKFGATDIQTGSYVVGILDAPTHLFSKRREVTYIFQVDRNKNAKSIIDNHYNIMKFYYSLSRIDEVLEHTKRNAQKDLDSFRIPELVQLTSDFKENIITELPDPYRIWSGNADLRNIDTGERGMVQSKATGAFALKDGHFALYRGPKYEDGQLIEN